MSRLLGAQSAEATLEIRGPGIATYSQSVVLEPSGRIEVQLARPKDSWIYIIRPGTLPAGQAGFVPFPVSIDTSEEQKVNRRIHWIEHSYGEEVRWEGILPERDTKLKIIVFPVYQLEQSSLQAVVKAAIRNARSSFGGAMTEEVPTFIVHRWSDGEEHRDHRWVFPTEIDKDARVAIFDIRVTDVTLKTHRDQEEIGIREFLERYGGKGAWPAFLELRK